MHGIAKDELVGEDIRQHRRAPGGSPVPASPRSSSCSSSRSSSACSPSTNAIALQTATTAARQQLLVSQSQANLASDRQLATLLAIEADRRTPNADTRNALLNAALAEPHLQRGFADGVPQMGVLAESSDRVPRRDRGTTPNRDVVEVWDWKTGRRRAWHAAPARRCRPRTGRAGDHQRGRGPRHRYPRWRDPDVLRPHPRATRGSVPEWARPASPTFRKSRGDRIQRRRPIVFGLGFQAGRVIGPSPGRRLCTTGRGLGAQPMFRRRPSLGVRGTVSTKTAA